PFSSYAAKAFIRYMIIRAGLETVASSRLSKMRTVAGGRGIIFTLHHVRPEWQHPAAPNAVLSVTPDFLEVAVLVALERGLVPVHLHELPALLSDPTDRRKFVAFTLDDGYRNNAE